MRKKSVLKLTLLALGLCLSAGCVNNKNSETKTVQTNSQEESAPDNSSKNVDDKTNTEEKENKEVKKDGQNTGKYDIIKKTYKKETISLEYPQLKTKNGLDDDLTRKWNKIIEDASIGAADNLEGYKEDYKSGYYVMDYSIETNNDKVISILCNTSGYTKEHIREVRSEIPYNIDVSTGNEIKLQDDPNFSKYVENIFYDKNYSISVRDNENSTHDADFLKEVKQDIYKDFEYESGGKYTISDLKDKLKNYDFFYKDGKAAIMFPIQYYMGSYAYAIMN